MNSPFLKIGAVVSALALGGAYVVIQQSNGSKQGEVEDSEASSDDEPTLMLGPKSLGGELEVPLIFDGDAEDAPPVLMPSSKVIVMPVFQDGETEAPAVEVPEAIMSSSKNGSIQLDPEELKRLFDQTQEPAEPAEPAEPSETKEEAEEQP